MWEPISGAQHIEDISETMARKMRAIRSYGPQFSEIDYARAIKGLNQCRGEMSGKFRYAEFFQALELDE